MVYGITSGLSAVGGGMLGGAGRHVRSGATPLMTTATALVTCEHAPPSAAEALTLLWRLQV